MAKATSIARAMVTRYGMVPELGHVAYDDDGGSFLAPGGPLAHGRRLVGDETNREIDRAVRELLAAAYERASGILRTNRPLLEEGARRLLDEETLDDAQLAALFARVRRADGDREAA